MTGRNRRASTSSVETVDDDQILWRQESSVLKSVAKDLDENDWPTWELRDTIVLNKDGQTLENLLDVATRGPFTIRGTLIIDDRDQKRHLLMRVRNSVPIEIRNCIRFSIGESDSEGLPLVWAEGKAGWYELNPTPAYQRIYNKMCEANTLYYRILDIYRAMEPRKAKKNKRPDLQKELSTLFHQYSAMMGDGSTLDEIFARCREHVAFLKSHCFAMQASDDFNWESTPFYKWLTIEHAAILKKAKGRTKSPPKLPRSPSIDIRTTPITGALPSRTRQGSSVSSITRSSPPKVQAKDFAPRQRPSRSRSSVQNDIERISPIPQAPPIASSAVAATGSSLGPATPAAGDDTPFTSVLDALELAYRELSSKKRDLSMVAVLNYLYANYKFPNYKNGLVAPHRVPPKEVLHYNAEALLRVLDQDKYGPHEFYAWLQEASKTEFKPLAISDWPYHLVRRGIRPRPSLKKIETPQALEIGGSSAQNPDDDTLSNDTGSSTHAGKGLKRRGRPAGKRSALRLATSSKKRPHSEVESDSGSEGRDPKRSHYFSDGDEVMEEVEDASSPEAAGDDGEELIKIVIRADKAPSTTPHGPNETWTCDQEDCDYVVRGGDEEQCQERIQRHFNDHKAQMERVNLARTESSRGHLPIKYAYFPPFLILVELCDSNTTTTPTTTAPTIAKPLPQDHNSSQQPSPSRDSNSQEPSGSTKESFHSLLDKFRRRPRPVSDKITKLTLI
ncbi:Fc.00g051670.m01.CDS01 [Cosmosporella sp. VM-42]